jgi:hypothetical protein
LTGTPLAGTNLPLATWVSCLGLLRDPNTATELARQLGVKWETAVRMHRRLVIAVGRPGVIRALRDAVAGAPCVNERR